ncbi:MAG: RNA polymerase sigma factor [Leptospirales bacterium]|jgi:RNA polymerase sigma factor (sigma-70 family)
MGYWTDPPGQAVDYDRLVSGALAGDLAAFEELLRAIQDGVFNLALKFLWQPEDAADATQEILLRVTTHLKSFRGESAFPTWAYRIAVNYLLNVKKNRSERRMEEAHPAPFDAVERELGRGSRTPEFENEIELGMLRDQVRMACLHAMLLCLNRESRMAFVLGAVLGASGEEGAYIMGIETPAFRKRLSRARQRMAAFMGANCGIVNPDNSCRCELRIDYSIKQGRLDSYLELADRLRKSGEFKRLEDQYGEEIQYLTEMSGAFRESGYYAAHGASTPPGRDILAAHRNAGKRSGQTGGLKDFASDLRRLYETRRLRILQDDPN